MRISEAISSGKYHSLGVWNRNIKVKITNFYKLDLKTLEETDNFRWHEDDESQTPLNEYSNIWVLDVEFLNLSKKPKNNNIVKRYIKIIDKESFFYESIDGIDDLGNKELIGDKLKVFSYGRRTNPKISRNGSIAFELPDFVTPESHELEINLD
ncbi:hypothetical protein R8N68_00860 [Vibrio sp. 1974]|uniref:hypothetical protein n=1 Tax=Vibrio sp. 1974 TaxID=3074584 RepID=UPI0029670BFB|nr:hypothetical protein [Vibrio sp. 1974]MDW3119595.1 hypothetical protein [Vibrio sp. 1974]